MNHVLPRLLLPPLVLALGGCAIGYNTALFTTKSNVGVDIDNTPATAEISVARREGVISPTFEGGQTPPVIASFRFEGEGLPLFKGVSSTFAGGDSAVILGNLYTGPNPSNPDLGSDGYTSTLTLTEAPTKTVFGRTLRLRGKGTMQPFLFGTDTMFGLKIGWSGQTAQYPDTVKLGYNRKELAVAPVFSEPAKTGPGVDVEMPSFFASSETDLNLVTRSGSTIGRQQYFATGKAANYLVLQQAVRRPLAARIDAEAAQYDPNVKAAIAQKQTDIGRIATYVGDPVDGLKLTSLLPNTGLDAAWAQTYAGQPASRLQTALTGPYAGCIPALAANLPATP